MKGRCNARYRLFGVIGAIFCLGVASKGILMLFETPMYPILVAAASMFLWMGLGFIWVLMKNMRTLELRDEKLIIGTTFGLFKNAYSFSDIKSVNPMPFVTIFSSYPGLLIKLKNDRLIHLHGIEFMNIADFNKAITGKVSIDPTLEIETWPPFAILTIALCVVVILFMIIGQIVGL